VATTSLFVEVLVIGALAELWIVTLLVAIAPSSQVRTFLAVVASFKDFATPLAIVLLSVTYAVGWIANFATERLFKRRFERELRDSLFEGKPRSLRRHPADCATESAT
jgi:hypothetical protein